MKRQEFQYWSWANDPPHFIQKNKDMKYFSYYLQVPSSKMTHAPESVSTATVHPHSYFLPSTCTLPFFPKWIGSPGLWILYLSNAQECSPLISCSSLSPLLFPFSFLQLFTLDYWLLSLCTYLRLSSFKNKQNAPPPPPLPLTAQHLPPGTACPLTNTSFPHSAQRASEMSPLLWLPAHSQHDLAVSFLLMKAFFVCLFF